MQYCRRIKVIGRKMSLLQRLSYLRALKISMLEAFQVLEATTDPEYRFSVKVIIRSCLDRKSELHNTSIRSYEGVRLSMQLCRLLSLRKNHTFHYFLVHWIWTGKRIPRWTPTREEFDVKGIRVNTLMNINAMNWSSALHLRRSEGQDLSFLGDGGKGRLLHLIDLANDNELDLSLLFAHLIANYLLRNGTGKIGFKGRQVFLRLS